ncbi:response regulator [Flavobacterium sp.]|uniref:response regulator n=1 Tax=Flavobacterium sp. TaxID=239 RepID=UPI002B4B366D|nr:response regulator [Flavobacterium sp.]HLF51542.1 response regulator [Flavobacterium sp.]
MNPIKNLMIIDDDDVFVFLTKKTIAQVNVVENIKVFDNGLDSINYIKENWENADLLPEVIFLDLSMPIMDGWQFLDEYILLEPKIEKEIIIYVISSSISPEDLKKAKSINVVTDFIVKPITKEKLMEVIK